MPAKSPVPINVVHLLPLLDEELIAILKSLSADDWKRRTIAKLWTVKDVAAHLLDGNIRMLSLLRDNYFAEKPGGQSYQDLLDFLNGLNADWVKAMKRVSPQMLIFLLELTGKPFCAYFNSLQPFDKSILTVDWVGGSENNNWLEIARQYTEKWLHQQQIRDAIYNTDIMTREFYYPFIDIFMLALPHTFRQIEAEHGVTIRLTVSTEIGGSWFLVRTDGKWELQKNNSQEPTTDIIIDPNTAWKLFSKSIRPEQVKNKIEVYGDSNLAEIALNMTSVMA